MPSNAKVIIEYGPYESNGIVGYSEDRLEGMKGKSSFELQ